MRKICIITGTRAEYGILYNLIKLIEEDPDLDLQLVVTGMHLSSQFGFTKNEIVEDGFQIAKEVDVLLSSGTKSAVAKSIGLASIQFSEVLSDLDPDIIVVLGDRFEIFAAVQSALILNIPVAHIHGGELTEGLIDEAIRHSITKMSHIHFTSTEVYRNRVIQLGEDPSRVFNFGAPGLDNIRNLKLLAKDELLETLGINLKGRIFLITYHPVTLKRSQEEDFLELLNALNTYPDDTLIFTMPNSDPDSRIISQLIESFVAKHHNAHLFTSLGRLKYLSTVAISSIVIGNSSSGLIEVPSLGVPTINIGARQQGREAGASVIHCTNSEKGIRKSIEVALEGSFMNKSSQDILIYGDGYTSLKILEKLKSIKLDNILIKNFYDVDIK